MRLRSIAVLLLAFMCWPVMLLRAQSPTVHFRHITYRDGLLQNPIATVLQDKSGYVWIGTWNGLSRYDGSNFKNFRPNDGKMKTTGMKLTIC